MITMKLFAVLSLLFLSCAALPAGNEFQRYCPSNGRYEWVHSKVDGLCAVDLNCPRGSSCVNKKCVCPPGFFVAHDNSLCAPRKLSQPCNNEDEECGVNAFCPMYTDDPVCTCSQGFPDKNSIGCVLRSAQIGESCGSSQCDPKLVCNDEESPTCQLPQPIQLGQPCSMTAECHAGTPYSGCIDGKCQCHLPLPSGKCDVIKLGSRGNFDCDFFIPNSSGDDSTKRCACLTQGIYETASGACAPIKSLIGETCFSNDNCPQNAYCDQGCDNKCICFAGFEAQGGACYLKGTLLKKMGESCDPKKDFCADAATCQGNSPRCACPPGMVTVDSKCVVDECSPSRCSAEFRCENTLNGYRCICPAGFNGPKCDQRYFTCTTTGLAADPRECDYYFNCTSPGKEATRLWCGKWGNPTTPLSIPMLFDTATRACLPPWQFTGSNPNRVSPMCAPKP